MIYQTLMLFFKNFFLLQIASIRTLLFLKMITSHHKGTVCPTELFCQLEISNWPEDPFLIRPSLLVLIYTEYYFLLQYE